MALPALALHVGAARIHAAVVSQGELVSTAVTRTPTQAPASELFAAACFTLQAALSDGEAAQSGVLGLGVGCGGPMQWPQGVVSPLSLPQWQGLPLRDMLADHFGLPVRVHNSAVCLTIGEHLQGAGQDLPNVMGVMAAGGIGAGLILADRLQDGPTGNAGHLGHMVVQPDGPECICGGFGCLQAVAAVPALVARSRTSGHDYSTVDELWAGADRGEESATRTIAEGGEVMGRAIASAIVLADLDLVVMGGPLSRLGPIWWGQLSAAVARHTSLPFSRRTRLVMASPDSVLIGAAALFSHADRYWHG